MAPEAPLPDAVLRQLERVLSSDAFSAADRSRALLKFLVERTLDGHSERLKEYTLGSEVLGRGEGFDPRTDPIVRAEASRLRTRLERYYASEGADDPLLIAVPKGSYVPRFLAPAERAVHRPAKTAAARPATRALLRMAWFALGAISAGVAGALLIRAWEVESAPPARVEALTALPGIVWWPTFSPDGSQVAFVWTGDRPGNRGIYVKLVGSSEMRRLTDDMPEPANGTAGSPAASSFDYGPQWSPDGLRIAFVRSARQMDARGVVHLVSALGGPSRPMTEFPVVMGPFGGLSWAQDSRFLAVARAGSPDERTPEAWGIFIVPVDGAEPWIVARAQPQGRNLTPAFSPDGRRLAYSACATREASPCDVWVVDLDPGLLPVGSPHRVTHQGLDSIMRIVWTSDARWLLYDTEVGPETFYLWRVAADGSTAPERIEIAGVGAWLPDVSGDRLAFTRSRSDADIVRFAPDRSREVFPGSSSYWDGSAHFSPDGRRIAFESMRSGKRQEIWVANSDGSNATQLTRGPGRIQGSPAWSPDGRRIVFDSQGADGHWGLYIIDVAGGAPRRLTENPGDENIPQWSRNGRWVYFSGRRGSRAGIWRVPSEGGIDEPLVETERAVGSVEESADGEMVYFTTGPGSPLFEHPLKGGRDKKDKKIVECVSGTKGFVVSRRIIYYVGCSDPPGAHWLPVPLHRFDPLSGEDSVLGMLDWYRGSLMISPDESTILYTSVMRTGSDLMLIENFGRFPSR